jgi:hypothetical protein
MCIRDVSNRLVSLWGLPPHISPFLLFGTPVLGRFRMSTGISDTLA